MCIGLATISTVVGIATYVGGAVMSGVAASQAARQQQALAEYQQQQALTNADIHTRQAQDTLEQGEWEKRNLAHRQAVAAGAQRAAFGASGNALGTGSALRWEETSALTDFLDMSQTDYDIRSRSWEHKMNAWNEGNRAAAFGAQADAYAGQQNGIWINAGLNALGGAVSGGVAGAQFGGILEKAFPGTGSGGLPGAKPIWDGTNMNLKNMPGSSLFGV